MEDACLLIADCPHTTAPDEGIGFPLVRTPNVGLGRLIYEKMHRVSEAVYNERIRRARPVAGDLIYAREAPAGNVALITKGEEVCLGQRTVLIRPNPDIANSVYLTYYLLSPEQRNRLLSAASGATVVHVNLPAIRDLEISLPPLPIQRRIAEVLGAYDDAIENNRRRMAILEKMARELYRERFKRSKTRSGRGGRAGRAPLPARTLGELFEVVRGRSYTSAEIEGETGTLMVNLKNIRAWGGYNEGGEKRFSGEFKPEQTLKRGDVVMAVTDMTQDRRVVGHVAMIPTLGETATFSADLLKLQPKGMSNAALFSLLAYSGVSKVIAQLGTGATVVHLKPRSLDDVKIEVPDLRELEKYAAIAENLYLEIDNLALQSRNLARQRDRLLPRLMSGRLEAGE